MKQITTLNISRAASLLATADISQIESTADKYRIIRALRILKPIAHWFDDFREDAASKLRAADHESLMADFRLMQDEDRRIKDGSLAELSFSVQKINAITAYVRTYSRQVRECIDVEAFKPNDLDILPISEQSIMQLVEANDSWTTDDCAVIEELFCE